MGSPHAGCPVALHFVQSWTSRVSIFSRCMSADSVPSGVIWSADRSRLFHHHPCACLHTITLVDVSSCPYLGVFSVRIDLAITSLLANQPVASERAQCQPVPVTPSVNLTCSFPSHVSRHYIYFIAIHC